MNAISADMRSDGPGAPAPEPLVLLPGFMCDARVWGPQIEALSPDHTILLLPLTRDESVEDMAQAVLDTAPERFAVAGMSLGAAVALEVMRRAPERVTRIALISANCLAETPPISAERETRIARAKGGRLAEVLAEDLPPEALAPGELRHPLAEFMAEMAMALGQEVYLRQARAMQRRPDQKRTLHQVRVPALVLCGEHDTITLPRRHDFVAEMMQKSELVKIAEAGHLPTLEAPDRVTEALRAWLNRTAEKQLLR
ncbi:Pimeloyl-ACP methyl ester carboxylesterase [Tranquillimonas rosea]|uniref:Pimeloyl-ACP methyl ester carboxylesterase n=1 Tax=Tranquillimonas rosea TaxID=641238 RepID=A0A1H9WDV0_9RHOB|nr:alpha/beta hydrolase [Tranquillimonas rosea]SES31633.1 Pimeloyl-ACP methyl ester carboxylesterase [Tranquillimonas rosea]